MQTQSHSTTRELGAMLKDEYNRNYCRENRQFTNGGAAAVQLQPGTIMTGGETPAVFDTAAPAVFSGLCLTTVLVQPGETVDIATLENGPAIVNENEVDFPADAGQTTTLKTAITAADIKLVSGLAQ